MKLLDKEKEILKLNAVTFIFVLFLGIIIFLAAMLTGCSSQNATANDSSSQEEMIFELKCKLENQQELIRAYEDVLHEVWLDKPAYVEDALAEGDAFLHLDEIMGENDVFRFHSKQDSIRYMNNWYGRELSW